MEKEVGDLEEREKENSGDGNGEEDLEEEGRQREYGKEHSEAQENGVGQMGEEVVKVR